MRASGGREREALLATCVNTSPAAPDLQRQGNVFIFQLMETIDYPWNFYLEALSVPIYWEPASAI